MTNETPEPAASKCPYCSAVLPEGAQVCPSCRAWIDTAQAKSPAAGAVTTAANADTPAAGSAAVPQAAQPSLKRKIDIAASTKEANRQTLVVLGIAGVIAGILLCLVAVAGGYWINRRTAQQAVLRSTQTVIAQVRTATAQVIATRDTIATRQAEPTVFALATQAQATADVMATQDAVSPQDLRQKTELWTAIYTDTFDQDTQAWYTGEDEDELVKGKWSIEDGQYVMDLEAKDTFSQWMWPDPGFQVDDFYLGSELHFVSGPDEMDGGLIFRLQDDGQFYLFDVTANGNYAVYLHVVGSWETIIEQKPADPFTVGARNLLEVIGEGSKYTLYINGQMVNSFRDYRLQQGEIGVLVGLPSAGDQGVWEYDNVIVRAP